MAGIGRQRTLAELIAQAAGRIDRLEPVGALAATRDGALLVDIRSESDRERDGIVPGSLHLPRTVLEWRLDPGGAWRSPHAPSLDQHVVLLCDHGCSSVLAASTLVELGFTRVADVVGGFVAWRRAGLPVTTAVSARRAPGELAGMRPPD